MQINKLRSHLELDCGGCFSKETLQEVNLDQSHADHEGGVGHGPGVYHGDQRLQSLRVLRGLEHQEVRNIKASYI